MPGTVNGIGTNYIGKRNLTWSKGTCEHCGAEAGLETYDTRLWFVILFIPVIPLGHKKVIDRCPKCSYHRVLSLAEWQRTEQESLEKLMQAMRNKPDDSGIAIELMQALSYFGKSRAA